MQVIFREVLRHRSPRRKKGNAVQAAALLSVKPPNALTTRNIAHVSCPFVYFVVLFRFQALELFFGVFSKRWNPALRPFFASFC